MWRPPLPSAMLPVGGTARGGTLTGSGGECNLGGCLEALELLPQRLVPELRILLELFPEEGPLLLLPLQGLPKPPHLPLQL